MCINSSLSLSLRGVLGSVVIVASLAGCASSPSMKIALTEMGTTSESEYGAFGMRMVRSINITGLGAEEVVGTLTTDPDKWSLPEQFARFSPTHTDLPDTMTPRLVSGQSMVVERRFDSTVTTRQLVELRDQLQNYQIKIADSARNELKKAVLESALKAQRVNDATTNKELIDPKIVTTLNLLYPGESLGNTSEIEKTLEAIKTELNSNNLSGQLNAIKAILQIPGIIITNWQRDTSLSAGASTSVADGSMSKTTTTGGLLILGSPRIVSLYLGDDLMYRIKEAGAPPNHIDALFIKGRNFITYYQLRAKQVIFSETRQSVLRANLEAHLAEVAELAAGVSGLNSTAILNKLKAEIAANYAAIIATSESGVMEAKGGSIRTRLFSLKRDEIRKCLDAEIQNAGDTIPVINMRVALDDFLSARGKDVGIETLATLPVPESDACNATLVSKPVHK